jgi:hypothetical protein
MVDGKRVYGRFDDQGTYLGAIDEFTPPPDKTGGPTDADKKTALLNEQTNRTKNNVEGLYKNGRINLEQRDFLVAMADAGQMAYVASALQRLAGMAQTTDTQAAAQDAERASKMLDYSNALANAKESGKNLAEVKKSMFDSFSSTQALVKSYEDALDALNSGANTGAIINALTPTIMNPTIALNNARGRIGLDVAASSKLQPISNSDLAIIMDTAIPTDMTPDALRPWLENKIAATKRAANLVKEGVSYFQRGDATFDGWLNRFPSYDVGTTGAASPRSDVPTVGGTGTSPFDANRRSQFNIIDRY